MHPTHQTTISETTINSPFRQGLNQRGPGREPVRPLLRCALLIGAFRAAHLIHPLAMKKYSFPRLLLPVLATVALITCPPVRAQTPAPAKPAPEMQKVLDPWPR